METCFLAKYTSWCLTHVSESMMTCICGVRSRFELSSFRGDAAVPSSLCPLPDDSGRPVGVVLTHEQKSHEILMICYWLCGKLLENITFQINKLFIMRKSAPKSHLSLSFWLQGGRPRSTDQRKMPTWEGHSPFSQCFYCRTSSISAKEEDRVTHQTTQDLEKPDGSLIFPHTNVRKREVVEF